MKGFESWFQDQQIDPNMAVPPRLQHPYLGNMLSPNLTTGNPPEFAIPASKPEGQLLEPVQKKFLVFDQSNNQTTLIYSSIPIPYHIPEPQKTEIDVIEKHENSGCSDSFREDSEELRALLYSDDEDIDSSEDEDEQSTGHSPVMRFEKHEWPDSKVEDVASSTGCKKRRKLDSGGYDVDSLEDTASSGVNCSGEAEFCSYRNHSGSGNELPDVESETFPVGKRLRKEKVRETISILENLIPGGNNGKDAMVILDEAINYLRILKVKAKAMGLDSL